MDKTKIILGDCMDVLRKTVDKYYDIAVVDPPYGIGEHGGKSASRCSATGVKPTDYLVKDWDNEPPADEYFSELIRVSKNQIIFGANHFIERIPDANSSSWIVWDKVNGDNDFADCELAWTSFPTSVRIFRWKWHGMLQQNMKNKERRIHPTQKPVALYEWIYQRYVKPDDKILDTHLGSGSSRIAAFNQKLHFTGIEIDDDYFKDADKRFQNHISQLRMF